MASEIARIFGSTSAVQNQSDIVLEIYYPSDQQTIIYRAAAIENDKRLFNVELREVFINGWISTPENRISEALFGHGIHGQMMPRESTLYFEDVPETDLLERMHEAIMMKLVEHGAKSVMTQSRLWKMGNVIGAEESFDYKSVRLLAQEHAPEMLKKARAAFEDRLAKLMQSNSSQSNP